MHRATQLGWKFYEPFEAKSADDSAAELEVFRNAIRDHSLLETLGAFAMKV